MRNKLIITGFSILLISLILTSSKTANETEGTLNYTLPCTGEIKLESKIPTDPLILNQYCANTFAWEAFIALNWPAAKNGSGGYIDGQAANVRFDQVGTPDDLSATVWETYADANGIFRDVPPPPWNENQVVPLNPGETCDTGRPFRHFNKITSEQPEEIEDLFQASGPQWLAAQNEKIVWYEILTNETEFDFINLNHLYNVDSLMKYGLAQTNDAFWLPENSMELKASWLQITDAQFNDKSFSNKYKIIQGCVPQQIELVKVKDNYVPQLSNFQPTYLALVGLHIIVKTPSTPQFLWASFEHMDNVPTQNTPEMQKSGYNFYNPNCSQRCEINKPYPATNGTLTTAPPNQTIRTQANSIGKNAKELNKVVQAQIANKNSSSVWQYYRLINVQWPNTAVSNTLNAQNGNFELEYGGGYPTVSVFGNPVSETYVQQLSCLNCHFAATFSDGHKTISTSYSFIFNKAKMRGAIPK